MTEPVVSQAAVSQPKVAVLLLNWRQAWLTLQCLEDLRACGQSNMLVLCMDNGSGAKDEELLWQEVHGEGVQLQLLHANLGYCAAMNRGIEWAVDQGARHVLFLNNDVRLPKGFLQPMVQALENDTSLAGVGPTILRPDGMVWAAGAQMGFCANLTRLSQQGQPPAPQDQGPSFTHFLPGACALYRLSDLQANGGLDEGYFMYMEDADLGRRLWQQQRKILWLPWVRVTHAPGSSSGGGQSPLRKYLMANNSLRYLRRHGSLKLWAAFWLIDCLGLPLVFLRSGWQLGMAKAKGLLHGFQGRRPGLAAVTKWVRL